jgi:NAD(P)-dependent dehydrogenase (short-subunit alcohol dehydrogenase family)
MRILLVGAHGTLGRAVAEALSHHEVIAASRSGGERVDLDDAASIAELYRRVGEVDAVACAAGVTPLDRLGTSRCTSSRPGSTTSSWDRSPWCVSAWTTSPRPAASRWSAG